MDNTLKVGIVLRDVSEPFVKDWHTGDSWWDISSLRSFVFILSVSLKLGVQY